MGILNTYSLLFSAEKLNEKINIYMGSFLYLLKLFTNDEDLKFNL